MRIDVQASNARLREPEGSNDMKKKTGEHG